MSLLSCLFSHETSVMKGTYTVKINNSLSLTLDFFNRLFPQDELC